jgi:N-glycosylase/DNA lyase
MLNNFSDELFDDGQLQELQTSDGPRRIKWGHPWQYGSAAFWIRATELTVESRTEHVSHRIGRNLADEITVCILGGFGMPFELGLAAYFSLREEGLLDTASPVQAKDLERVLSAPLRVGEREIRYRFPAQRAARVAGALNILSAADDVPEDPLELRDWLLSLPGIGLKTASWVVRNHKSSADVAILDVHVVRAGVAAGVFDREWKLSCDYRRMERLFVAWANVGGISASDLDSTIWFEQAQRFRAGRHPQTLSA